MRKTEAITEDTRGSTQSTPSPRRGEIRSRVFAHISVAPVADVTRCVLQVFTLCQSSVWLSPSLLSLEQICRSYQRRRRARVLNGTTAGAFQSSSSAGKAAKGARMFCVRTPFTRLFKDSQRANPHPRISDVIKCTHSITTILSSNISYRIFFASVFDSRERRKRLQLIIFSLPRATSKLHAPRNL